MIQFGTIKFRRIFENHFGQFVWIEKNSHYNSRVSLHETPTKKLKTLDLTNENIQSAISLISFILQ